MANRQNPLVIDSLENRQLFAYAGGFSPAPFMQMDSAFAIVVSFNRSIIPYMSMPWGQSIEFHQPRHEMRETVVPNTPVETGSSSSNNTTTTTPTAQAAEQPSTDGQAQTLSFASRQSDVPEVQAVASEARRINVTGNVDSASQYVPVKIASKPIFNTSSNLIEAAVARTATAISPQLISSLATSAMSTQKLLASTLLGELKTNTARSQQTEQTTDESENVQPNAQAEEKQDIAADSLAIAQPNVLMNKTFLYRMAVGMTAFLVISYWWTRRLAQRMQSVVIKNENDSTSFDR